MPAPLIALTRDIEAAPGRERARTGPVVDALGVES